MYVRALLVSSWKVKRQKIFLIKVEFICFFRLFKKELSFRKLKISSLNLRENILKIKTWLKKINVYWKLFSVFNISLFGKNTFFDKLVTDLNFNQPSSFSFLKAFFQHQTHHFPSKFFLSILKNNSIYLATFYYVPFNIRNMSRKPSKNNSIKSFNIGGIIQKKVF